MQITIPLSALQPWAGNPRKDLGDLKSLIASIGEHGLIEPLIVRALRADLYDVICGNRRLAAISKLVAKGELQADPQIECSVLDHHTSDEHCLELAVAENTVRLDMGPIEEADAFTQLVADGKPIKEVAAAYGVTVRYVEQRQALVKLLLPIKKLVAKGELPLSMAAALTIGSNEQQRLWLDAFKTERFGWHTSEAGIRRHFTDQKISISKALFDPFAADLVITRDLFAQGNADYFDDADGFWKLQRNHIDTVLVPALTAEGWRAVHLFDGADYHQWHFSDKYTEKQSLPADAKTQLDALNAEAQGFRDQQTALEEAESEGEAAWDKLEKQIADIEDRIEFIESDQNGIGLTDKQRKKCDAHVIVAADGGVKVRRGLISNEEKNKPKKPIAADGGDEDDTETPATPELEAIDTGFRLTKPLARMLNDLRAHAVGMELIDDPLLALRFVVAELVVKLWRSRLARQSLVRVERNAAMAESAAESRYPDYRDTTLRGLKISAGLPPDLDLGDDSDEAWNMEDAIPMIQRLEQIGREDLLRLLAVLVSGALVDKAQEAENWPAKSSAAEMLNRLGKMGNASLRRVWTPGEAFLAKVSKAGLVEIATQSGYANPKQLAKMKPGEIRAELVKHFKIDGTNWTPAGAGFPADAPEQEAATPLAAE